MSNQLKARYDIIVNGGGIVGFTLLNLIQKSRYLNGCKVLLIEQALKPTSFKQPPRRIDFNQAQEWTQQDPQECGEEKRFSNRVSSITQTSEKALRNLGVWGAVEGFAKDVRRINVWNYSYSNRIVFHPLTTNHIESKESTSRRDVMFSVVENNRLSLALLNNIYKTATSNQSISWGSTLEHIDDSSDPGLINILAKNRETGEEFSAEAPLLLGCDGYKSKVRDFSRLRYSEVDLNKSAVVGTVKMSGSSTSDNQNTIAHQRFSANKDTVTALLPLDNEYSSFVISAPNEFSKYLAECDEETFINDLNELLSTSETPENPILNGVHSIMNGVLNRAHDLFQALPSRSATNHLNFIPDSKQGDPPRLESVIEGSRACFPLIFGTTTPKMTAPLPGKVHSQIALLGDSSHRVHPLAGQGLNLGIQDAVELVKQLEGAAKCGERIFNNQDLSSLNKALRSYECKRQLYIAPMSASILSMPHLFKLMPSSMVDLVDKCTPVKSSSVRFANGC